VRAFDAPIEVVTTTGPVVAAAGTLARIRKFPQNVVASLEPFNVALPGDKPKFSPMMLKVQPGLTVEGSKATIVGVKLKVTPLLFPFTLRGPDPAKPSGARTTIFVALQLTTRPGAPLKVIKPGVIPNPEPRIVTCVNGGPRVGLTDVMTGGGTV